MEMLTVPKISYIWEYLSTPSQLLSSSKQSVWRGFDLCESKGAIDVHFDIEFRLIHIHHASSTTQIFRDGSNQAVNVDPYPMLALPGDHLRGAWRSARRTQTLSIEPDAVERLTGHPFRAMAFRRPAGPALDVQHLLRTLHIDVQHDHPCGPLLGESVVTALLHRMLGGEDALPDAERLGTARQQVERLRDWVEANLARALSLEEMAAEVGLSPRHLCRMFQAATGCTPYRYILVRRVERAKRLIQEGRLSLSDTASAAGFANQSHMAVTFRKVAGISPSNLCKIAK